MADLTFTVQDFASLSTDNFAQQVRNAKDPNKDSVSVQVGSSTYRISTRNDRLEVTRNFGWLNLFRKNYAGAIQDKLKKSANFDTVHKHTEAMLGKAIDAQFLPQDAPADVAMYGLAKVRHEGIEELSAYNQKNATQIKGVTIDEYNAQCGIFVGGQASVENIQSIVSRLKTDTIDISPAENNPIAREKLTAWKDYLRENVDKVDIFKKISTFIQEGQSGTKKTGWAGLVHKHGVDYAMEAFVRKNVTFSILKNAGTYDISREELDAKIKLCAQKLKAIADLYTQNGQVTNDDLEALGLFADSDDLPVYDVLDGVLQTAFFRQTSKLGLEFFRKQGTPVLFQWSDFQGRTMGKNELHQKWWKQPLSRIRENQLATITQSEMRHVERLLQTKDDTKMRVIKVHGGVN